MGLCDIIMVKTHMGHGRTRKLIWVMEKPGNSYGSWKNQETHMGHGKTRKLIWVMEKPGNSYGSWKKLESQEI